MDISKKIYAAMTPADRAKAYWSALGRLDEAEMVRLVDTAPSGSEHKNAILRIDHAGMAYPIIELGNLYDLTILRGRLGWAAAFCKGWEAAGGSLDAQELLKDIRLIEQLLPEIEKKKLTLNAAYQAAYEWCESEGVDPEDLARPFGVKAPVKDPGPVDEEALELFRKVFDAMRLGL